MKIIIIANGENFSNHILKEKVAEANIIIAADGGVHNCLVNNITPDYVVGDIDSTENIINEINEKTQILRIAEQETTDMQKALTFAESLNPSHMDIFCCFGKRTDHSLGNIFILNNYENIPITMYDEFGIFNVFNPGIHYFNNQKGKTVSLFTISELTGVNFTGFEYPLMENSIGPAFIGVSNKISDKIASIKFEKGRLLVYELYD